MRVAIYGGSFDPPHVGHAMVAAWLRWTDRTDEVWLLPTYVHAFEKDLAPFDDRLAMCERLAAEVGPFVRVEPIERELPAPSYTVDTLDVLSRRHPDHRFRLVVGADVLPTAPKWKDWDRIEERWGVLVVGRQGFPSAEGRVDFPDVSSTEVRRRLRAGEPVDHLVPAAVLPLARACYSAGGSPMIP